MSEMIDDRGRAQPWFPGGERVAFFVGLVVTLYLAYLTVEPVLLVFVLACAVASLTYGLYARLTVRLRGRRRTAAAMMVMTVLLGVLLPLGAIAVTVVGRMVSETTELATRFRENGNALPPELVKKLGPLGRLAQRAGDEIAPAITEAAPKVAQQAAEFLAAVGKSLVRIGIAGFLLAIALYYLYLNGVAWRERLVRLMPLPPEEVRNFLHQFHRVSVGVLIGNVGTAAAQGVIATLGYTLFGVPVPLVWGLLTFAMALVPAIGTVLVWAPLAVWAGLTEGWARGVGLAAYGVLAISTIDNLMRPILTRRGLKIHPLLVFLAVFGGVASYGFAGLFLGPLAVGLAVAMVDAYERRMKTRES